MFMNDNERIAEAEGLDLIELLRSIWLSRWLIIVLVLIGATGMYVKTQYFTKDYYTSNGILYVSNKNEQLTETKKNISSSDINTSRELSVTYMEILRTSSFLEEVAKEYGGKYSWGQIAGMLTIASVNETELLLVSVRAGDPTDAYNIATTILNKAPDKLKSVFKSGEVEIVDPPRMPRGANAKGTNKSTFIGALAGFVLGVVIVVLKNFFDTKVRKAEDVAKRYNVSILGELGD